MAVVRDNNKWNADLLTDLQALGSDDGVTSDVVAWADDQNNWYYPNVINAGTSTWTAQSAGGTTVFGQEGVLYNGNTFYVDANDRNSYAGTGTSFVDLINGTTGTMTGITITDGHFNFDGGTDDIDFGTVVSSETQDIFDGGGTVVFWVRPESDGGLNAGRIADTSDGTATNGWYLRVDSESAGLVDLTFIVNHATTPGDWGITGALTLGQWYHIAVVYNDDATTNDPTIYINGVAATIDTETTPVGAYGSDSGNSLIVGNSTGGTQGWDGDIDVAIWYDRSLSAAEVRQLFRIQQARLGPSIFGEANSLATGDSAQLLIQSGDGPSSGDAGDILIQGGSVTSGGGGNISILATDAIGSGNAGGTILIEAGGGSSFASAGNVEIAPGVGASGRGNVIINNNGGNDTEEVLRLSSEGTNAGTSNVFVGGQTPVSVVTAIGAGDLYVRTDTGNLYQAQASGTGSWVEFATTATSASSGIPGNIYEDLQFYMDPGDRNSYPSTGSSVTDLIGNGTGGTITTATFEDGAFNFNGASGDISFTKGAALDNIFSGGGTIMAWVRVADNGELNEGYILDTTDDVDEGWDLQIVQISAGHVSTRFRRNFDSSTGGVWTADQVTQPWSGGNDWPIHLGSWTSITITYDDASATNDPTFYINGTVVSNTENTAPVGSAVSDAGNPLTVGNRPADDRTFDGQISVCLMWDRTLAADEIQKAHSAFSPRFGQGIRGMDSRQIGSGTFQNISGQDIWIRGGDSLAVANSETEGGHIYIIGGDHTGGGNASAGRIYIKSGDGTGNVTNGGDILIESGTGGSGGNAVTIRVGDQSGGTPGDLTLQGGDNPTSGPSGDVFIRAGASGTTTGGTITVRAGEGNDVGASSENGGPATFRAGDGIGGGAGGLLTLRAGDSGTTGGTGGSLVMRAGDAQAGNANGGDVSIDAGDGSQVGDGGTISLTAGLTEGDAFAGDINITAGNSGSTFNSRPAGDVNITTGNMTGASGNSNSGGGDLNIVLGSSVKTGVTSPGGSMFITGGAGTANSANSRGGAISGTAGDVTGTTAGAIAGNVTWTGGQATGAAGTSGSVTCAGGAAGFSAGTAGSFTGIGGAGNSSVGGDSNLTGGSGSGANAGGGANVTGGAGGSTGDGGVAAVEGGAGGGSSGAGGQARLKGGNASAGNGDGGVALVRGGDADGTGANGGVGLVTTDTDAAVAILTTGTSFQGTTHDHFTYGVQITVNISTTGNLVVVLGTLDTNGRNLKVNVRATGVENTVNTNVKGFQYAGDYYRDSGTVSSLGSYQNNQNSTGTADWNSNVAFAVAINGNDIELQIDNNSTTNNYTINVAVYWDIQQGGFTS